MKLSPTARRLGGITLAGAVALATVTVTASPASAAGADGQASAQTSFETDDTGAETGNCVITSGGGTTTPTTAWTSNGVPTSVNHAGSATAADDGEAGDTTTMSSSVNGTLSATETAGSLKTFDMTANSAASVLAAQGAATDCHSVAGAAWTTQGTATITSTQIMVLEAKVRGGGRMIWALAENTLGGDPDEEVLLDYSFETNDKQRRVATVPPGTYQLIAQMGTFTDSPETAGESSTKNSVTSIHAKFYAPGSAPAAKFGSGKKYLDFDNSLNCAGDSVTADFTKKAGKKATNANGLDPKIRKAKFYVNGTKVKTANKPHKNTEVTLNNLDDTDEVTVKSVLKLWNKRTVEVTRSYLPCS